jgi:diguanylate cyclase (GGDEF)-like protein
MAIFPTMPVSIRDAAQELRFVRFLLAAAASAVAILLIGLCYALGLLEASASVWSVSAILTLIAVFYLAFRSGMNQRFADPSLTIPMMVASLSVTTYVLYSLSSGRGAYLMVYLMAMFFGVFRLSARQMLKVSGFTLVCYGGVIVARLYAGMPTQEVNNELLQWLMLAVVLVWFSFMGGYVSRMVTRLGEAEVDEVSGVYTRRRILEILRHERLRCSRGAGPLAVCMLDIDRFKAVNDSHGHVAGDSALRSVMAIASTELRTIDFLGRFGGDEFLIVLPQTGLEGGRDCAERVRQRVESSALPAGDGHGHLTVSIGVAEYRPQDRTRELIARADQALYAAKSAGRNRVSVEAPAG